MPGPLHRALRFAAGGALVFLSWSEARRAQVPSYEERLFRVANDAPDEIRLPVRAVMQAGTYGTVPAVAILAFLRGRRRLGATLFVGGTAAWLGAKALKRAGGRERPAGVFADVRIREDIAGDLGWPSGHTAVAGTLAFVAADALPGAPRSALGAVVAATGFGRMYVGAHLPHDLVGGAGLAMMLSAVLPPAVEPR
ncbi:MAG: phosphatase PAP2 family protein [Actinomycetota bacterium]